LRDAAVLWAEQGWNADLPAIRVVLFLGAEKLSLIAWDNRRLIMLKHLLQLEKMTSIGVNLYLAEARVLASLRKHDPTLQFPFFREAVPAPAVAEFLDTMGSQDAGVREVVAGIPKGHKPQTWGQMIFLRTSGQPALGSTSFPLDGSTTNPVVAVDREEAYGKFVKRVSAYIERVDAEAALAGCDPVYQQQSFDFAGNPTIFDHRTLCALNVHLRNLTLDRVLDKVQYLAEWCSQIYERRGYCIPAAWKQLLTSQDVAKHAVGAQFESVVVDQDVMTIVFGCLDGAPMELQVAAPN